MKKILSALLIINLFALAAVPVLSASTHVSIVVKHDDNKKKKKKGEKSACCSQNEKSSAQGHCSDKKEGANTETKSNEKVTEGNVKPCCNKEASQTKSCH